MACRCGFPRVAVIAASTWAAVASPNSNFVIEGPGPCTPSPSAISTSVGRAERVGDGGAADAAEELADATTAGSPPEVQAARISAAPVSASAYRVRIGRS